MSFTGITKAESPARERSNRTPEGSTMKTTTTTTAPAPVVTTSTGKGIKLSDNVSAYLTDDPKAVRLILNLPGMPVIFTQVRDPKAVRLIRERFTTLAAANTEG
jgi:hypothetical protein